MTNEIHNGRDDVVEVPSHRTFRFLAERQTVERADFAMAVSLLDSADADDRHTGRDLLEQVQIRLNNKQINSQRQIEREYQEQW